MLTIKHRVTPVDGKGLGLVAGEKLSEGQKIWYFEPLIDMRVRKNLVDAINNKLVNEFLDTNCDLEGDYWFVNGDNTRFMNHSDSPTVVFKNDVGYATRDLDEGDELTCDYREIGCKINFEIK